MNNTRYSRTEERLIGSNWRSLCRTVNKEAGSEPDWVHEPGGSTTAGKDRLGGYRTKGDSSSGSNGEDCYTERGATGQLLCSRAGAGSFLSACQLWCLGEVS